MTIVYGVTFVGGRLQIERQLKDLEMNDKVIFKASTYLVTKVFASIGEMFTAARAIQVSRLNRIRGFLWALQVYMVIMQLGFVCVIKWWRVELGNNFTRVLSKF